MRYQPISPEFYVRNRARLVKSMKPNSVAVIHSNDEMPRSADQTFTFRQNSDLFYLTGLDQEKCILLLCPYHPLESMREVLFTVKTNESMVTWFGHKYTLEQASLLSGIKTVKWLDDFELTLRDMLTRVQTVYLNQNDSSRFTTEVISRDIRFAQKLHQEYPAHSFERLAPLITELRLYKQPEEIAQMQKACNATGDAFRRVLKFVKPGVKEYEVEAEMTHEFIRQGCSGHSYLPIVASGKSTCILHYCENDRVCQNGDLLLLDFGAEYGLYAADLSRTIPINGKFTPRQRQVYDAVLRVLRAAIKLLKPGETIDSWHKQCCKLIENELVGLGLINGTDIRNQGDTPAYFKYYMHGTGHFIGLDVHDVGTRQTIFKPGTIITVEPGIYIAEEGLGVRIENNVLITENGTVDLMENIPIEADEIERLMAN